MKKPHSRLFKIPTPYLSNLFSSLHYSHSFQLQSVCRVDTIIEVQLHYYKKRYVIERVKLNSLTCVSKFFSTRSITISTNLTYFSSQFSSNRPFNMLPLNTFLVEIVSTTFCAYSKSSIF